MALFETHSVSENNKYTRKTMIPQYVPTGIPTPIVTLTNNTKYIDLLREINQSNVSEEEKQFLRLGASRHIVFNYAKIADYYANATPEMQKLMEHSALVIIDINDAIANGYAVLSKEIETLMNDTGEQPNEN